MELSIGIDLGTSSIKICIVDKQGNIQKEVSKYHGSDTAVVGVQVARKICECTVELLQKDVLSWIGGKKVSRIGIAGQMHGIVAWNAGSIFTETASHSELYTWLYPKGAHMIPTLPKWKNGSVHPGFGILTLLQMHQQWRENGFDRCGTIMDLLFALLTKTDENTMSWSLAQSWGYCNFEFGKAEWEDWLRAMDLSVKLPNVEVALTETKCALLGFESALVRRPWGDLQASIRSVAYLCPLNTAYLVIGTSAQLCVLVPPEQVTAGLPHKVWKLPYSDSLCLLAACAMMGGNSVDDFLKLLRNWTQCETKTDVLLEKVDEDNDSYNNAVTTSGGLVAERGQQFHGLSIHDITPSTTLVQMLRGICNGVVDNLFSMFPLEYLHNLNVRRIVLVGSAKKRRFARRVSEICSSQFEIEQAEAATSAAFGVAF